MKALYIASTGMAAQERNVEVISNNIANMRTTGYKKQRVDFQDLLYQQYLRAGSQTSDTGSVAPIGIEVGSGVRAAATPRVMSQGTVNQTEKELDVAVDKAALLTGPDREHYKYPMAFLEGYRGASTDLPAREKRLAALRAYFRNE